jgi:diguanylate cyclase (GGDEF)-like protein
MNRRDNVGRQKILVIDDSPQVHHLVRARLGDEPLELHSAGDGAAGLALARTLLPDLILLDIEMPGLDGLEVCRRLKTDPLTAGIPIVFLAGACTTEMKMLGLDLGGVDFVNKPFETAELRARVRSALRTNYLLELLVKKAMIDGPTGLWNRSYFDRTINAQLSLARRSGHPLGCIVAEIDRFRALVDRHGPSFGEELVRRVGQLFVDTSRVEDVVCLFGSAKLAVITPNTPAGKGATLAERLREGVRSTRIAHREVDITVTCSFGLADAAGSGDDVIAAAERAAQSAASAGGDRTVAAESPQKNRSGMYALCADAVEW